MIHHRSRSSFAAVFGLLGFLTLGGCSEDDENPPGTSIDPARPGSDATPSPPSSPTTPGATPDPASPSQKKGPLLIVTERQGPDVPHHYLHVLSDWPSNGRLDHGKAMELGEPGFAVFGSDAMYFYHAKGVLLEKITVDEDLRPKRGEKISFGNFGLKNYDPEPTYAAPDRGFLLDEITGFLFHWNPTTMEIEERHALSENLLRRDGLKVQFQHGLSTAGRLFTATNWRDRDGDSKRALNVAALTIFDENNLANGPRVVEDPRCKASGSVSPFRDDQGNVYVIGDGMQGYDNLVNPNKSPLPQCVVRMPENGDAFDPAFFVDLNELTKSPAINMAYPMAGNKLLLRVWSPDVPVRPVANSEDWFWSPGEVFEYMIVDLNARTATKVEGLPRARAEGQKNLTVDGQNYVQLFRQDRGTTLHRVDPDGTVTQVIDGESGANVQYIGRLSAD